MATSLGLMYLDMQKIKDISDEYSLVTLAQALEKNRCLRTLNMTGIKLRRPFLVSYLNQALQTNITLTQVIGKIAEDTIQEDLDTNVMITEKVEPCFELHPRITRQSPFNLKAVDPLNTSLLDVSGKDRAFIPPSFKFMRFHNVCAINFTNTGFDDGHMNFLATYLMSSPALYSVTLD